MEIKSNTIILGENVKKPKKITGTRFASVLGLNPYQSPFQAWCEITKTYEESFKGNAYTIAGEVIEPKVVNYLKESYYMRGIKTPEDVYGDDPFKSTWGNFFDKSLPFGGMWDSLNYKNEELTHVIEIKTTSNRKKWEPTPPDYNALQACLYTYLLGIDKFILTGSFLDSEDYVDPHKFIPTVLNTNVYEFSIKKDYPQFFEYYEKCEEWYKIHVLGGISPEARLKKDLDLLDIIKLKNGVL